MIHTSCRFERARKSHDHTHTEGAVENTCSTFERARKSHDHTHTRSARLRTRVDRSVQRQEDQGSRGGDFLLWLTFCDLKVMGKKKHRSVIHYLYVFRGA